MTYTNFYLQAGNYLKETYCLDFSDLGISPAEIHAANEVDETPTEFIEFYAQRYALTKIDNFTYSQAQRIIIRRGNTRI